MGHIKKALRRGWLILEATRVLAHGKNDGGRGYIVTGDSGATSRPGVWAGGDIVTGSATVILAMGAGKKASAGIDQYLREEAKVPRSART